MFNINYIKRYTGFPDEHVNVLVQIFYQELLDTRVVLTKAGTTENWQIIKDTAHKMKPSFIIMGFPEAEETITYFNSINLKQPNKELVQVKLTEF